ncbi:MULTISPECIES: DUF983 domain-containing protein [Marinicauda]|uniref:DUF983 domain-containing protein n=1 Tax=Marinicauda pacifica TaxID=1133559 RepID=A0A4S2HG28_9PROT|nr:MULTISPECIES: DUF983 domain-containing protein [Marinicauda]TGY94863.1 DUF983 domain-containing protein [Marinicauda pacifica]
MTEPSPFSAGLAGRCPRCGEGRLFEGFLTIAPECETCGLDFSGEDAGDGPAVFIMFLVGAIVVPLALLLHLWLAPPTWVHLIIWIPVVIGLSLWFLRPFKGVMFALQYKHSAREARLDEDGDE